MPHVCALSSQTAFDIPTHSDIEVAAERYPFQMRTALSQLAHGVLVGLGLGLIL
jgi:hypothetical protein